MVTRGSRTLLRPAEEPTLLCAFPLRHQRSMRALAIPLEICNGFKLLRKSDIFIVRVWNNGQPLTIIRGIFLRDVHAQMVNLYGIIFSFSFSGALKCKLDMHDMRQLREISAGTVFPQLALSWPSVGPTVDPQLALVFLHNFVNLVGNHSLLIIRSMLHFYTG